HLGMSGQLHYVPAGQRPPRRDHVHCMWWITTHRGSGRLVFRDPRRFGGLWTFSSMDHLRRDRWSRLGPDALTISAAALHRRLRGTRRRLKAALLDQRLLCGIGNIYVDESLFAARIHPCSVSLALPPRQTQALASAIRATLRHAIRAGGSTFRDYLDGRGQPGRYTTRHQVYGRAGSPCLSCGRALERQEVGQRTTVACRRCQQLFV
ncbi:MAG: Fpg/Nei family DNA glycosylase, partial [Planctomycetota bacterium]